MLDPVDRLGFITLQIVATYCTVSLLQDFVWYSLIWWLGVVWTLVIWDMILLMIFGAPYQVFKGHYLALSILSPIICLVLFVSKNYVYSEEEWSEIKRTTYQHSFDCFRVMMITTAFPVTYLLFAVVEFVCKTVVWMSQYLLEWVDTTKSFFRKVSPSECIICRENNVEVNHMCYPCGHLCLCAKCSDQLEQNAKNLGGTPSCPYCRTLVEKFVRVYQ